MLFTGLLITYQPNDFITNGLMVRTCVPYSRVILPYIDFSFDWLTSPLFLFDFLPLMQKMRHVHIWALIYV